MKKYLLLICVVVIASAVNTSCSKDNSNAGNPLVGSWIMTDGTYSVQITFSADNTGSLTDNDDGVIDLTNFTYSVSGNQITMNMDGETDYATFSISGNTLTVIVDGETLVFTAV